MAHAHPLHSSDTRDIALWLTDALFDALRPKQEGLAAPLRALRDALWPDAGQPRPDGRAARGEAGMHARVLAQVPPARRAEFMEQVARMGHLRQLASLIARDHFLAEKFTAHGRDIPGTGADFIAHSDRELAPLLAAINGVIFNPVFTAHPTNNNALSSMRLLGAIGKSIRRFCRGGSREGEAREVLAAVRRYAHHPVTPMRDGKDHNLSVPEETGNTLYFLGEIHRQLPEVLAGYDAALVRKFGAAYDPLTLRPNYKFDAWGSSGDKDGNKLVNATTTLEAILQHRRMGAALTGEDLARLRLAHGLAVEDAAPIAVWEERWTQTMNALDALHAEHDAAVAKPEHRGQLPDALFDSISRRLAGESPDVEGFDRALVESYRRATGEAAAQLLGMLRNLRIFGGSFGRIEFRETAEEFGRVTRLLIGEDYPDLLSHADRDRIVNLKDHRARLAQLAAVLPHLTTALRESIVGEGEGKRLAPLLLAAGDALEERRTQLLTEMLQDEARLDALRARMGEITAQGVHQPYGDSPYPIAYQTIKRMALARDFPRVVVKQVLAECQAPSNALEAKLMMKMAASKAPIKKGAAENVSNREPVLGVVPLFEDPEILDVAQGIMRTIVTNPVYAAHLRDFRQAHPDECAPGENGTPRITQEVQFAHSDNGRRGGMPAARAFIYKAHEDLQALGRELGIAFEEFHGGSSSDPYRGGTRSYIGMIRDYGLQDKFKLTLQGGDLLNIFNYEGSIRRYLGGVLQYCAQQKLKPAPHKSTAIDRMARAALMGTLKDYQKRVFKTFGIGALFGALADMFDLGAGATGSRQQRSGVGFGHTETEEGDSTFLDPDSVRTITFSELLQHNQINPTWVGALELSNNIRAVCAQELPRAIEELQKLESAQWATQDPAAKSRFLRALGIEQTKAALRQRIGALKKSTEEDEAERTRRIAALKSELAALRNPAKFTPDALAEMSAGDFYASIRGIHPGVMQYMYRRSPAFRDVMDRMAFGIATTNLDAVEFHHRDALDANPQARSFLRTLKLEYVKAATIVHAALTGHYRASPTARDELNLEMVRDGILSLPRLAHLKRDVEDNMALLDFINSFKDGLRDEYQAEDARMLHALHVETLAPDAPGSDSRAKAIRIGTTSLPVRVHTHNTESLFQAMGSGRSDADGHRYEVRFEISRNTPQPHGMSASYLVRFGDAARGPAFALPHDDWIRLREEVIASGRDPQAHEALQRERKHLFRLIHTAADTATHVYYPTAGDRAYGQARFPEHA